MTRSNVAPGVESHQTASGRRHYAAIRLRAVAALGVALIVMPAAARGQAVSLSPTSLTFSSMQFVGSTSAPMNVTLTNTGTASLSITSITLTGSDAADYAQTNNCGSSVAAAGTCTIGVTFTPSATGTRTATLNINDNAPGSPQTVSLTGTGVAPAVSFSPTELTFASQVVNTSSAAMSITLSNTGTASLSITNITVTGDAKSDFSQTNTCSTGVGQNSSCTIMVTFKPTASGTRSAALSVLDNASNSPQTVSLTGMGGDFSLSSSPTTVTVSPGQSASYQLTVTPIGGFNVAVSLTCQGAPPLGNCSVSPASVTPDGSNASKATVTVTTSAPAAVPPGPSKPPRGPGIWVAALAAAGLALLARHRRRAWALAGAVVLFVALWAACGGGTATPPSAGTPLGNYSLTLSGTSGTLSHTMTVTLNVQ